ncbi:MAG: ROK family transcriptional regulator [Blautia sp.]|nr:ROK family transcriptional regulator [Blautia sp.]
MASSITPGQIRRNNRLQVYHYIYNQRRVSQQDICYGLGLSRPTVTRILPELEKKGLIRQSGPITSDQVGRKAGAWSICTDHQVALGVSLTAEEVRIMAVDLYGQASTPFSINLAYHNADFYYKEVCRHINEYVSRSGFVSSQVMGIGITLPGLIAPDGQYVIYGKLLKNTGMPVSVFSDHLSRPCTLIRDMNSAAVIELWHSPELDSAFYLSLSEHLGAALISGRAMLTGKHGHSAVIEHLPMVPDGELCYCGKHGCAETVCSARALLREGEDPAVFFEKARQNGSREEQRLRKYLQDLSTLICRLHLVYDTDFILGGTLSRHLTNADVAFLHEQVRSMTPISEDPDFISVSKAPDTPLAVGAALPYIWSFLGRDDI